MIQAASKNTASKYDASKNGTAKYDASASENILLMYFKQLRNIPLLSFEEELELSRRIEQGDEAARRKLVESNLRLVIKIAKSYSTPDVPLLDLIQEGNMGLLHAAQKYDHTKNVRFSTYANWWIRQAISRSLCKKRRAIRLPQRKEELIRRIQRVYHTLSQSLQRQPAVEDIAAELGVPLEEVEHTVKMANCMALPEIENQDMETTSFVELYEDYTYSPERTFIKKIVRADTLRFLDCLKEQERRIVMYRYLVEGGKRYTLKKIATKMGISPETVRQIELRALRKMKDSATEEMVYSAAM